MTYASIYDALEGAARVSYEALETNKSLTSGPAMFVVDRTVDAADPKFAIQQALLETQHGRMAISLDEAVRLDLPKGASDPQAIITRTQPRIVGMASSSGIVTGFGTDFNEYVVRNGDVDLLQHMRNARA